MSKKLNSSILAASLLGAFALVGCSQTTTKPDRTTASDQKTVTDLEVGQTKRLPNCDGTVTMKIVRNRGSEQVALDFKDVDDCSVIEYVAANYDVVSDGSKDAKFSQAPNASRVSGSITLPKEFMQEGSNYALILFRSGTGKTSDYIRVHYRVATTNSKPTKPSKPNPSSSITKGQVHLDYIGDSADLPACKGKVRLDKVQNADGSEQPKLDFKDVDDCSVVEYVAVNGDYIGDGKKDASFQQGNDGLASGSVTLPKRFMEEGSNTAVVVLRSQKGKHQDRITIRYRVRENSPPNYQPGNGW